MRETAWPLIRADLALSYVEVGLLLSLPNLVGSIVQPGFGVLADAGRRRTLVLGGGLVYAASLVAAATAWDATALLVVLLVLAPASGAFVSLSQATLMDVDGAGPERNMARWVVAGSVGVVLGPAALSAALAVGGGWRETFLGLALLGLVLTLTARRLEFAYDAGDVRAGLRAVLAAVRRVDVLRWLFLKDITDLMGDVLFGFLALYFVDVVGVSAAEAALAVAVWTAGGLVGDLALLPLLRRVSGIAYLRVTAAAAAVVFPAFMLVPGLWPKLVLVFALGAIRAGWYAIPKARLFAAMSGRSGAAVALSDLSGLPQSLLPLAVGALADQVGLESALWLALLAPLALLLLVPRRE